jgi:nucleotide-binding universal stress UspA family protein
MDVFSSIVCGIDESPEGLEALARAQRLRPAGGKLHLVTVEEEPRETMERWSSVPLLVRHGTGSREALARALGHAPDATSSLVDGEPVDCLLAEAERIGATAIVVGSHGQSRLAGLFLGGTTAGLLHRSPITVLVARKPRCLVEFPATIAVGVDGSTGSRRALDVARELGARLDVPVRTIAASGGKPVFTDGLRDVEGLEWSEHKPVNALLEVSAAVDLLVIGSRGVHGLEALGSVSERVANRAFCSVLVVRNSQH